jgi:type VI secretion system protein ImpK
MTDDGQQGGERTILVPRPGRRAAAPPVEPPADAIAAAPLPPPPVAAGGVNPLVAAANPLLDLVVPLRIMVSHPDVAGLRSQLVTAIRQFEALARTAGYSPETVAVARYALCTFLDETISATPWGSGGVWASRSLLVAFHNEAFGGEKFFQLLQKLSGDPRANLHLLELMYLCLALGLEGRYRVIDNGRAQLETLRERLQQLIRRERGSVEAELSPHWLPSTEKRPGLARFVPLWLIAFAALLVLVAVQLALSFLLNRQSDPVYAGLNRIRLTGPMPAAPPANPPVRVARFLAPEIEQGLVSVTETPDRSTVVLHGDGVFASGSADVRAPFEGLLARIGDALRPVPGKVIVIGHTDDVPSASARFPSNWALSKARAATVVRLLAERSGPTSRYSVEGRGETEPLVRNDSAANRARNRRVVIVVLTPPASLQAASSAPRAAP